MSSTPRTDANTIEVNTVSMGNVEGLVRKYTTVEFSRELEFELAAMTAERDEYRRLYEFRGRVLLRPCIHCGHKPVTILACDRI